jgi:hypothetical protein
MPENIWIALIVAMPPTLMAFAALVTALVNARRVATLTIQMNGHLAELIELNRAAATASAAAASAAAHAATATTVRLQSDQQTIDAVMALRRKD